MPKVGNKKFAYDKKGIAKAKEYAKETGQDIPTYDAGGRVEKIQGYGDMPETPQEPATWDKMPSPRVQELPIMGPHFEWMKEGGKVKSSPHKSRTFQMRKDWQDELGKAASPSITKRAEDGNIVKKIEKKNKKSLSKIEKWKKKYGL